MSASAASSSYRRVPQNEQQAAGVAAASGEASMVSSSSNNNNMMERSRGERFHDKCAAGTCSGCITDSVVLIRSLKQHFLTSYIPSSRLMYCSRLDCNIMVARQVDQLLHGSVDVELYQSDIIECLHGRACGRHCPTILSDVVPAQSQGPD